MCQPALSIPADDNKTRAVRYAPRGKAMRGHLPRSRDPVRISVTLPAAEYRVYASVARLLTRIMGAQAPAVAAVMRVQLGGRSPAGIADDHLDSVDWPLEGTEEMGRTG
jgi:hypothetical protein